MKTIFYFLVLLTLLLPVSAHADGNDLLKYCNAMVKKMDNEKADTDYLALGYCIGLMQGVTGTNMIYQTFAAEYSYEGILQFCAPPEDGIKYGQAARIVVKYLKEHPEFLHENEVILTVMALKEAFPCKE